MVSVKPFGKVNVFEGIMQFTASRGSSARPTRSGRMLTVDLATAMVRDDETGLTVMSGGLGSLTSKIFELRTPLWLTDEDAMSIALLNPRVTAQLQPDCRVYVYGAFRWNQALVAVSCKGNTVEGASVSVNLQTGEAMDPCSGRSLESAEAARAARERLAQIQKHRAELQKEVAAACRPE
jgi:hypothetical protein